MKTDPEREAYTCARCGRIETVAAFGPGPQPGICRGWLENGRGVLPLETPKQVRWGRR